MHIKLVVPSLLKDLPVLLKNIDVYFRFLPIDKICIIGDDEVRKAMPSSDSRFSFVDETTLIDVKLLTKFYNDKCNNIKNNRIGWYIQQFAKMSYALHCPDEYYLVWDSDTIPVKPISLLDSHGQPFFDFKTEYHKQYFDCISRMFPNCSKQINGSFIAEHMLIKTSIMKELINAIEANNSLEGNNFQEKIISAVNPKYLMQSGFSEFETYGTYTLSKYPSFYILRKWKSLRNGGFFFQSRESINEIPLEWLSEYYDAISFEKKDKISLPMSKAILSYYKYFNPKVLEKLSFIIKLKRYLLRQRLR